MRSIGRYNIGGIILLAIAIVSAFLFIRQCERTKEIKSSRESEISFLKDSISYYKNELGQEVAEKRAIRGDKKSLEVLLSKQIDSTRQLSRLISKFKNINAAGNVTTVTRIDSIPVPYEVVVPFEFYREWSEETEFYSLRGSSNQFGNTIYELNIPNTLSFAIGDKKTGWLSTEYRIEATNSNPHVQTTGLDTYTFKEPVKRWGIGPQIGGGLSQGLQLGGYIGIGISYDLIRF